MILFSHQDFSGLWRKVCTILLALCFLSGLSFGVFAYISAEEILHPMMRRSFYSPVSITGLLTVTCLPFIVSALAVYISQPALILAVGFGKAFLFSFVALGLCSCLQGTGCFPLLLFICTDILLMPLMYFCWLRGISGKEGFSFPVTAVFFSLYVLIISLYIRFISPFWLQIVNFRKG